MKDKKYPPREGDLPREELMKAADQAKRDWGENIDIHFKFTCQHCGRRCMLQEPDTLYENGECDGCGKITPITVGGFTIIARMIPGQN